MKQLRKPRKVPSGLDKVNQPKRPKSLFEVIKHTKMILDMLPESNSEVTGGELLPNDEGKQDNEIIEEGLRLKVHRIINKKLFTPYPISNSTIIYFSDQTDSCKAMSIIDILQTFDETNERQQKFYFKYEMQAET